MTNSTDSIKRMDIQILRAIAVLAVLFFHLNKQWLPLGYLGVDLFFVISGFVITRGILLRSKSAKPFCASEFLCRRVNRLFPPLLFTIFLTLILGFLFYPPELLTKLASSSIYAIIGVANFWFFTQTDYFSAPLDSMPLLHTWSLSVEEQFYVFFALATSLLSRLKFEQTVKPMIFWLLLSCGSLYLCFSDVDWINKVKTINELGLETPEHSFQFFMIPTRIYQLAFGILAAYIIVCFGKLSMTNRTRCYTWCALAASVCCAFFFSWNYSEVKYVTLGLCVITTALLIVGESDRCFCTFKPLKILIATGNRSYSIYLIHWPIIVFVSFIFYDKSSSFTIPLSVILTALFAEFSWRFFERTNKSKGRRISILLFYSVPLLCLISFIIYSNEGLKWRVEKEYNATPLVSPFFKRPSDYVVTKDEKLNKTLLRWAKFSTFEPKLPVANAERILVLGDSHALRLYPMAQYFVSEKHQIWDFYTFTGEPPIFGYYIINANSEVAISQKRAEGRKQVQLWEKYLEDNINKYKYVILASRWNRMFNHDDINGRSFQKSALVAVTKTSQSTTIEESKKNFIDGLRNTIQSINNAGAQAIVIGQPPLSSFKMKEVESAPKFFTAIGENNSGTYLDPYEEVVKKGSFVDSVLRDPDGYNLPDFFSLVSMDVFCDHEEKICNNKILGFHILKDTNHLSYEGCLYLAKEWEKLPDFPFQKLK